MKPQFLYAHSWLDYELPENAGARLWVAGPVQAATAQADGSVLLTLEFRGCKPGEVHSADTTDFRRHTLAVRAYGEGIIRLTGVDQPAPDDAASPMIERDAGLRDMPLTVKESAAAWDLVDQAGVVRLRIPRLEPAPRHWETPIMTVPEVPFRAEVRPDGKVRLPFQSEDTFAPRQFNSVPLGYVERPDGQRVFVASLEASSSEHFAGTGERFARMDLAGQTLTLENSDGLGVNNRRAYKNIPFYLSSRGYGLFAHTSAHLRVSLADISTRAALLRIEEPRLDLFFIGGGSVEKIVHRYRQLTGFPPAVPLWSYGTWMARMTYFSAEECEGIAARLRAEDYPCDVIHLDTGWFRTDWKCEWEFSPERFPDPAGFMARLRAKGFRTTLWQTPWIVKGTKHYEHALAQGYILAHRAREGTGSEFGSGQDEPDNRAIDFSNPAAVRWYQELLGSLFQLGASAIKTDFGEFMDPHADYHGLPYSLLHNRYPLLYQRAAWEATAKATGEPILWARSGWAGCQRYPVHWGGDCACTWDGLAGSLRGGLHFGLSGFAFWSHDVPGFHGLPNFMFSWPSETLYLRWTQAAIFGSHLRYHGTSPREPWEYPGVAPLVRGWLRLRYALIPYLLQVAGEATRSGYPVMRALVFHHSDDPVCWHIDDQFYCGPDLLIAPVLNDEGVRDVYLPAGEWVDFWSGRQLTGRQMLRGVQSTPARIPIFVRAGAVVPYYPRRVPSTNEMKLEQTARLTFDATYRGFVASPLGGLTGLPAD
jgi:alpha-D-xyloside xylohydrolase